MSLYLLVGDGAPQPVRADVLRYTNRDRVPAETGEDYRRAMARTS